MHGELAVPAFEEFSQRYRTGILRIIEGKPRPDISKSNEISIQHQRLNSCAIDFLLGYPAVLPATERQSF